MQRLGQRFRRALLRVVGGDRAHPTPATMNDLGARHTPHRLARLSQPRHRARDGDTDQPVNACAVARLLRVGAASRGAGRRRLDRQAAVVSVGGSVAATDGVGSSRCRALCRAALVRPFLRLRSVVLRSTGPRGAIHRPKNSWGPLRSTRSRSIPVAFHDSLGKAECPTSERVGPRTSRSAGLSRRYMWTASARFPGRDLAHYAGSAGG